jgi:cystathionine beta-lyase family protein involved in aluminum resistance
LQFNNSFWKFGSKLLDLAEKVDDNCQDFYRKIDNISDINNAKVLESFVKNRVGSQCFNGTSGYGYDDVGRDKIDLVFSDIFQCEDSLVRHSFVSGTHALSVALFGILRPGDTLISITGKPYDTLHDIIGVNSTKNDGSLTDFGVKYQEISLLEDGQPDLEKILQRVENAKVAYIQRSKGSSLRPAFGISQIKEIIQNVKKSKSDTIVIVDNCYGEFTDIVEPTAVGADLIVGSLIKNPGGGIARTGGYICGKKALVEKCSYRLTTVGMGKEVGCSLEMNREILLGIYNAPNVVANALKIGIFASKIFEELGFETFPKFRDKRSDIVTGIKLNNKENLVSFCKGIQKASPIDSYVTPEPWPMPGYNCDVIMAAGAFTMGASSELSADAPLREPFAVWLQGGTNYTNGIIGVLSGIAEMSKNGNFLNLK